jgi:nitrogen fixation/metabolism regulation signal transduction histidine kinase
MATNSVASGDLNIEIRENYHGEVRELLDGFNYMVKELKRNQVELRNMEREAAWRDMAKQVAHEIKNPLTPMRLSVQQLIAAYRDKSDKFDNIFNKVTQTLIKQIDMLKNIASEFSTFARMPNIKVEDLDLKDVINDTINLFIEERIKITHNVNGSVLIKGDKEQLRRIMINLIRNAVQANADAVNVELNEENGDYQLLIKDNGDGIPDKIKEDIFNIDFTTKDQGMGLGLTMAKRYMDSVGGDIRVRETSEQGTTIELRLKKS